MPHPKPNNGQYQVQNGRNGVLHMAQIDIDVAAWNSCSDEVQLGVINMFNALPIVLLSKKGRDMGIKQEDRGLEFHTQTNDRLQSPGGTINNPPFHFTQCTRGYGH